MHEDNQSCIKFVDCENIKQHAKHIDTKYHYVKQLKDAKIIQVQYCPTEEMLADLLTKPLEAVKLKKFVNLIGLCYASH